MCLASDVAAQDAPGDQLLRFRFSQKFSAGDNIRLQPDSVGTTYWSDTLFGFDFENTAGLHALSLSADAVGRIVDDPIVGIDSGIRDPRVDLAYLLEGANGRFSLVSNYFRPDLAFSDPLTQEVISEQDFFSGGGTREEFSFGARLETGLQSPFGIVAGVDTDVRRYLDTTDPLLFDNRTDNAEIGLRFQISPVFQAQADLSWSRYSADDSQNTERETVSGTIGFNYEISPVATLNVSYGDSKVTETFDTLPGTTNTGPVASVDYVHALTNGVFELTFDNSIDQIGRQTTLAAGRSYELPNGALSFSIGVTEGSTFDPRPIGSIDYTTELARSRFSLGLSRSVAISDIVNEATETTRFDLGYEVEINPISSMSFDVYYADIIAGSNEDGESGGREKGSFYATYNRSLTEDWNLLVGYSYRYYEPDDDGPANSSGAFLTVQRNIESYR